MSTTLTGPERASIRLDPENYQFLQEFVYRESGIVLDRDKHYLMEARLSPIVAQQRLGSLNELCRALKAAGPSGLRQQVVDSMTTNETMFFREPVQYDALRKVVLPRLMEQRRDRRRLNFWSAAASSGQEAYSLAMMLREMGLEDWYIQINATDLSTQILERARQGRFLQIEVNRGLPVQYLVKYFRRDGMDWIIRDEIRNMVRFERFDLRQGMGAMGPFDVVFCRNVLIYFDVCTKKRILGEIRSTLFRGGHLLLGGSETTLGLDDGYELVPACGTVLYRVP
ncbi:CheR family methyltransferase [Paludibaculum fermentans]|uniref:CheR family methyltransferase n=1 Tax=Paludibaculum fermentans TaxID=1473598 RepID=UPI003EB9EC3E